MVALADDRSNCHELKFGVGHHKRFETWKGAAVVAKRGLIGSKGNTRVAAKRAIAGRLRAFPDGRSICSRVKRRVYAALCRVSE